MMKLMIVLPVFLAAGCVSTGIWGSGRVVSKDVPSGAFERIQVQNTFQVEVTQGPAYSVTLSADDNLWDYVDVYNDGGTLHLGMKGMSSYQDTHLTAKITLPRMTGIDVNGAASAVLHGVDDPTNRVELRVGGASTLDGEVRCREILVDVSGAATVTLRGSADALTLDVQDASHAHLNQFLTRATQARVGGAADASIIATGDLDFDVSGAAHFSYAGRPIIHQAESSGASTVHAVR